jgi:hypothetical protein
VWYLHHVATVIKLHIISFIVYIRSDIMWLLLMCCLVTGTVVAKRP